MRRLKSILLGLFVFTSTTPSLAGVYSDDLGKCLVKSLSPADQTNFVRWIFSAMALHPDIQPLSNISATQHTEFDQKAAALYGRLMTVDCRAETIAAIKYEGAASIEASFSLVGQVAMRALMSDPAVVAGLGNLDKYFDKSKMDSIYKDAGVATPAPPK